MSALPPSPQVQGVQEVLGEAHHYQQQEHLVHWQGAAIHTDLVELNCGECFVNNAAVVRPAWVSGDTSFANDNSRFSSHLELTTARDLGLFFMDTWMEF